MVVEETAIKVVARNKKAFHEYHILETFEAGIVLKGTEVKSVRAGSVNLSDAFARVNKGALEVLGLEIAQYSHGNIMNHEPKRKRTLLMHRREIARLKARTEQESLTLIPLSLYFKKGYLKLQLGLAKGKKLHDKRESERKRDAGREVARATLKKLKND